MKTATGWRNDTLLSFTYNSHNSTAIGQNESLRAAISGQALPLLRISLCLAAQLCNTQVLQSGEVCVYLPLSTLVCMSVFVQVEYVSASP